MHLLPSSLPIRLLTHNIRYATTNPFPGEELWATRLPYLLSELNFNVLLAPNAFICLQEVLHEQLVDLLSGLNSLSESCDDTEAEAVWAYIGVGRDDGFEAGEYSPILYRTDVWEVMRWKTVWLSETPDVPSKGWDAASTRIVTVGLFRSRAAGQNVLVMSTHFDDQGVAARLESAKLINTLAKEEMENENPVVLAGDFNSEMTEGAYQEIVNSGDLKDVAGIANGSKKYGCSDTFTGFDGNGDGAGVKRIDFVFVGAGPGMAEVEKRMETVKLKVKSYGVLDNQFDGGVRSSDHRAVVVDLLLAGDEDE